MGTGICQKSAMQVGAILREAWEFYRQHLLLMVALVATIWVPCELFSSYMDYYVIGEDNFRQSFKLSQFLDNFFGIIATAAVISVVMNSMQGQSSGYLGSLEKGFSFWGKMWWMRFVQGLLLLCLFILLILPGIYFMVRWSLAEAVVVSEGMTGLKALRRSRELTMDRFWPLFWLGVFPFLIFLFPLGIYILLITVDERFDLWWVDAAFSLSLDFIGSYGTVVLVCAYRTALQSTSPVEAPVGLSRLRPPTAEQW